MLNDGRRTKPGYGGGYGYYYGTEGSGGSGNGGPGGGRNLRDYLAMLRERIWLFLLVFIMIFGSSIVYLFVKTPQYSSMATVELLRDDPSLLSQGMEGPDMMMIRNQEDLNTQINTLQSGFIIGQVANRLRGEKLQRFMAPYEDVIRMKGPFTPPEVLGENREVIPFRQSLTVGIKYTHPDPELAAEIANIFADEFIEHNVNRIFNAGAENVDSLKVTTEEQRKKVQELDRKIAEYTERHDAISFNQSSNINDQRLIRINDLVTRDERALEEAQNRWSMIEEYRSQGRDLWDLPFIGDIPRVSDLLREYSAIRIQIAQLKERYRHKHPKMIEAVNAREQILVELDKAVDMAVKKAHTVFVTARDNYDMSQRSLGEMKEETHRNNAIRVEYNGMLRELEAQQALYQGMITRLEVIGANTNAARANVNIMDRAARPLYPSSPNIPITLAMGLIGGFGCGIVLVYGLAFIDDRVKSSLDIESNIGMPLIAVVPKVGGSSFDRARISATNSHRRVAESFRTAYSTIKISEAGKDAKVILLTSTQPSEGKTFVATNLASTYAAHGERVLIIDADLRMPAVAESLDIEEHIRTNGAGLTEYFDGNSTWERMIVPEVFPNMDVLASAKKSGKPTQIINSQHFQDMVTALREYYDRIIVDTPPIGIVGDVLSLAPIADGLIYVVRHNTVKVRNVKTAVRRVMETQLPVFGAVMNQVTSSGGGYYSSYYSKGFDEYYAPDEHSFQALNIPDKPPVHMDKG